MDPLVEVKNLFKSYGKVQAVKGVSFKIKKGEFFSLLGPSGCGKTTILRILGGFIDADRGSISIDGTDMTRIPPNRRNTSMVFQNLALFPHMDVSENIIYGLKKRRIRKDIIEKKLKEMLDMVNLSGYQDRRITELSGGQQQRVALARSLIIRPQLLLLDEPLASLDKKLRIIMRSELKDIQSRTGTTFLYVTHDQSEALNMSDTIAVMNEGSIVQTGSAKDIYDDPVDGFVADFIGAGNFIRLKTSLTEGGLQKLVAEKGAEILLKARGTEKPYGLGGQNYFFIRPEKVKVSLAELAGAKASGINLYSGMISSAIFEGPDIRLWIDSNDLGTIVAEIKNDKAYLGFEKGNIINFYWDQTEGKVLNRL